MLDSLPTPLASVKFDAPLLVPNADGLSWDVLLPYYKSYQGPAVICVFDLGSGVQVNRPVADRRNVHLMGHVLGSDGRLYWALQSTGGLDLWVYDPRDNSLVSRGIVNAGYYGQTNLMITGPDGMLYGTVGHRGEQKAGFYRIDPAAGTFTDFGPVGDSVRGSPYAIHLAADDRCLYAVYGKTPFRLIAFDRETREARELLTSPAGGSISLRSGEGGCTAVVTAGRGGDDEQSYRLDGLQAAPGERPDSTQARGRNAPGGRAAGLERPEFDLSDADPALTPDRSAVLRYRLGRDSNWKEIRFRPPLYGMSIGTLHALPDGRLFAGNGDRGGYFFYDPKSSQSTYLGRIPLEHHCTAFVDGRLYMAGYPGGLLYEFDIAKPWTASYSDRTTKGTPAGGAGKGAGKAPKSGKKSTRAKPAPAPESDPVDPPLPATPGGASENPRFLCQLKDFCGMHFANSAAVGADGRAYFGGFWYRDGEGGGFAWWDPGKHAGGGFSEPLSTMAVAHLSTADDGRYVVISATLVTDRVLNKPTPPQARLHVFDTRAGKAIREIEPLPGAVSTGLIAPGPGSTIVGLAASPGVEGGWVIYGVDVESCEVRYRRQFPAPPAAKGESQPTLRRGFATGPDGRVWLTHGGALVRIDPADGVYEIVGRLEDPPSKNTKGEPVSGVIAFVGRDMYLGGDESLRRIKDMDSR
jgi:hypothetical protein